MKLSYIFTLAITLVLVYTSMGYAQSKDHTTEVATTSIKVIKTKVKGVDCATDVKTRIGRSVPQDSYDLISHVICANAVRPARNSFKQGDHIHSTN